MNFNLSTSIKAPVSTVWKIISDLESAKQVISAIEDIEIVERPQGDDLVGLKWRETRTLFGKTAEETMTITESVTNSHYVTHAASHGSEYRSSMIVKEAGEGSELTMTFEGKPQTFMAKVMAAIFTPLMKGSMRKAIEQDLADIKAAAEAA
ncbi:MAG: SRPBCC family protein [Bacteroidota bacterium]